MNNSVQNGNNLVIEAYVDGSYNSRTNEFSYGYDCSSKWGRIKVC